MILSDNWLLANNFAAVRLDLTIKSLSHPADCEPVNQMWEDITFQDVVHLIGSWSNIEDTAKQDFLRKVEENCLSTKAGCTLSAHSSSGRQMLSFIVTRNRASGLPIIAPFHESSIGEVNGAKVPSFGLSSYGYDVTLQPRFKIFTNINSGVIDPLEFDENNVVDVEGPSCIIPPNSYMLAPTNEYFSVPNDVLIICLGKSTYARCGAIVNVTPIEPGFEGNVVIEISNATPSPMRIHANFGIAQFVFFRGDQPARTTYKSRRNGRGGKYQGQTGITLARA